MNYDGKTVIITGASGGIGKETACLFAEKGANIVVNYFASPRKAENTVKAARSSKVEAFSFRADVADPNEVSSMIDYTVGKWGRIDVLVNNAAKHPPPFFDFAKPDWEYWKRLMHVNVMGILVCSHFAALMLVLNAL